MPLNRTALATSIRNALLAAKAITEVQPGDPPPEQTLADALADAIDAYVRGAAVRGVRCGVPVNLTTSNVSGHTHGVTGTLTATQNQDGNLQ